MALRYLLLLNIVVDATERDSSSEYFHNLYTEGSVMEIGNGAGACSGNYPPIHDLASKHVTSSPASFMFFTAMRPRGPAPTTATRGAIL